MKRLLIHKRASCHRRWFRPVLDHFKKNAYRVSLHIGRPPSNIHWDRVIIWNGNHRTEKAFAKKLRRAGVTVNFLEVGHFPQSKFGMLSRNGSVGGDLFAGEQIPSLPSDGELRLQSKREEYIPAFAHEPRQISGFLQLESDFAVRSHSPYTRMQQYIDDVEARYGDAVFKVHPLNRRVFCKARKPFYRGASIWPHIMRAKRCVGINSTALYEAVLAGVPVTALGECPLKRHPTQHREIIHEMLLRQFPVDGSDIGEQVYRSIGEI